MSIKDAAFQLRERPAEREAEYTDTKTGTVLEVREDYEDRTMLRVEVQLPPVQRERTEGPEGLEPDRPTFMVTVPKSMDVQVDDPITVTTTVVTMDDRG
jgi:hypothetical protein